MIRTDAGPGVDELPHKTLSNRCGLKFIGEIEHVRGELLGSRFKFIDPFVHALRHSKLPANARAEEAIQTSPKLQLPVTP